MSASFVAVGNNVPGVISWNMSLFFFFFFFLSLAFVKGKRKGEEVEEDAERIECFERVK